MTNLTYEELIAQGIEDLPVETLAEIVDFVYFVRKRALAPLKFHDDIRAALLQTELRQLGNNEQAHLEREFQSYDRRFPKQ